MLFLTALLASACSGVSGGGGYGRVIHHDIYYRNPWYRYDRFPPPRVIGPPPTIEPPIEPPAVQLPIEPPIDPPIFEAVPLEM